MIRISQMPDEFRSLLSAACDGTLSKEDAAQLENACCNDDQLKLLALYLQLDADLSLLMQGEKALDSSLRSIGLTVPDETGGDIPADLSSPTAPVLGFLGNAYHGTIGFFSQEVPFACLIATVLMSVALAVCSQIYITHHQQFARSFGTPDVAPPLPSPVARITGMVDVKWGNEGLGMRDWGLEKGSGGRGQGSRTENLEIPKSRNPASRVPSPQSLVIGDRLEIASGLVQLTYNSGAKVILQGPCTYEVNSPTSGFLALGKLTARMDSGKQTVDDAKPQASDIHHSSFSTHHSPNPQSPIPNPFVIQTPTAIVTDLGTEFGVEVCESGITAAHVYQGLIEIQPISHGNKHGEPIRLAVDQSAQVYPQKDGKVVVVRDVAMDSAGFVRVGELADRAEQSRLAAFHRWQAYSEQLRKDPSLLAYYDFQLVESRPSVLRNVAGDSSLDGVIENATWTDGRMPGKHALLFQTASDYVRLNLPQQTNDLTLAVWVAFDYFEDALCPSNLLISDDWDSSGRIRWQVWQSDGCMSFAASSANRKAVSSALEHRRRRWTHLASVYNHSTRQVQFFVDGRSLDSADLEFSGPLSIGPAWIGNKDGDRMSQRKFRGRMDELLVFSRALKADELQQMYQEGRPEIDRPHASYPLLCSRQKPIGPGKQLVYNGSFEIPEPGKDNGWYHSPDGWDILANPFQAYIGSPRHGRFRGTAWNGGSCIQTYWCAGGFTSDVTHLALGGWAKVQASGGIAAVVVTVGNMTGDSLVVHDTHRCTITEDDWTKLTAQLAVRHGNGTDLTNYAEIRLIGESPDSNQAAQFDDLSLTTITNNSSGQAGSGKSRE